MGAVSSIITVTIGLSVAGAWGVRVTLAAGFKVDLMHLEEVTGADRSVIRTTTVDV